MEYRIGQVFEVKGKWYQFVEDNGTCCNNCVFSRGLKCKYPDTSMQCAKFLRLDGKSGHVVLLDAIGGEYKQGAAIFRDYRCQTKPVTTDRRVYINNSDSDISLIISIRLHDLIEKFEQTEEDMEEKKPTYEELLHYYHSTVGLWAIDRSPQEVSLDWICDNAFQLGVDEEDSNSENIRKNLREFDLEAAKSGKPVCTRSGKPVRIICFDVKGSKYPIIALVKEDEYERLCSYMPNGRRYEDEEEWPDDLMMLPEKKKAWVNVYTNRIGGPYTSREYAIRQRMGDCIDTVKIQWEE